MRGFVAVLAVLAAGLAGCGSATRGSCMYDNAGLPYCSEWGAADRELDLTGKCAAQRGVWSSGPCPAKDRVGSCHYFCKTYESRGTRDVTWVYYLPSDASSMGPGCESRRVDTACSSGAVVEWTPN